MVLEKTDKMSGGKMDVQISSKVFKRCDISQKATENKKNLVNIKLQYQNKRKIKGKFNKNILTSEKIYKTMKNVR